MEREYPKGPVLAVAAVILKEGSVLLVKRANEPSKGEWSLPGGVVELGETAKQALRREIKEELSIEVRPKGIVDVVEKIVRDDRGRIRYHYVILEFMAEAGLMEPKPGSDVLDYKWMKVIHSDALAGIDQDMKKVISKALSASKQPL